MTDSVVFHNVVLVIQILEIIMNMCALFFLLIKKNEFQQRLLIFMCFATAVYNVALLGEILPFTNFTLIYYAKCVETIAVGMFQIPFIMFCFQYVGKSINIWMLRALMFVYGIISFEQFFDLGRGLHFKSISYIESSVFPRIEVELGVLGICFWVLMVFGPIILELCVLGYGMYREKERARRIAGIGFMLQVVGSVSAFFIGLPIIYATGYDPFMLVTGYALCAKIFLSWRKQGLDVISVAAKSALDSLGQAVVILDRGGKILYFNNQAKYIVEEVEVYLGRNIKDFINFAIDSGYAAGPHEFVKDDMIYHSEWNPIIDSDGESVGQTISFVDITAERMAVEEMKEKKNKADEANAAKSIFLANMSHEIRTPMNAIIGMSELIIEESRGRKVYDMAVQIKKASRNLLTIINNILDYSKMEADKMDLVEDEYYLEELVVDTFNLINIPAMERGLSVNLALDKSLPCKLYGDDGKIRQVLINLLNNAIKFTKRGHIDLTVNGKVIGKEIELIFSVADTGSGISEENQKIIFESFEQVDKINNKSVEGTGLGLSITKGLVDMMGGRIALSSVYGEGSTFSVSLKQRIVDNRPISEYSIKEEEETRTRELFKSPETKVLICDDNNINLLVVEGMLEAYELDVTTCNSGKEAINLVTKNDYDIIMMDHMMPEMDGIEATNKIRTVCVSKTKKPHIIALTANTYEGAHEMFLSRGFDDYLPKPVDKLLLYDKLINLIPESKISFTTEEIEPAAYTEDELAELFMSGVDVRMALDEREGSIKDYLKVLELYYLEGESKKRLIKDAYESKDYKNYEVFVHGLKSTSLSIGAVALSDLAKEHEFAAKNGDIQFINDNYEKLCSEYDRILDEIKGVLVKKGIISNDKSDENNENKIEGMTHNKLIRKLHKILELSEDFRSKEAYNELQELLDYKLDDDIQDSLEDIALKFKMYDDDGAEEELTSLLERINEA
ncbi:MAG: response regulator [Lachnospiraceae bacterium]|nr:response regulator [Lachnospiraceae bacterium]